MIIQRRSKMIKKIEDSSIQDTFKKRKIIMDATIEKLVGHQYDYQTITANSTFVKYTNIRTQYKMLDSDSLYLFCSELSNDLSENKASLEEKSEDTYISSFYLDNRSESNASDVYSQWMSYCKDGGVAFEFYFGQDIIGVDESRNYEDQINDTFKSLNDTQKNIFNFSLLCGDAKSPSDYFLYKNFPFQVSYYDNSLYDKNDTVPVKDIANLCNVTPEFILPFFKHSGFIQECEARLVFINKNNRLSKCIKFIDKNDGTKIPYIEVKFGSNDNEFKPCDFVDIKPTDSLEEAINKKINIIPGYKLNPRFPIIIPQGREQEKIYNLVEKALNSRDTSLLTSHRVCIICQGHLPITKITVAPTNDRAEQKKMLEIYCKSKYWLRNVEICESQIPYNTVNNNHT